MTTSLQSKVQRNGHYLTTTLASRPEADEFNSDAFEDRRESLPYLQMLNAQASDQSGFFITAENVEAAGFVPNEEWVLHEATFQSGAKAEGYRSLTARFLILRRSKLMMFDRDGGECIGIYRKSQYDRATMILKNRYLVYIVGKDKQPLHSTPLVLTAKGAFCGSFGEAVDKFRVEMSKAYGVALGAKKPRGDRFMALSILAVRVQPELKGTAKKSWVCSVAEYCVPTVENWRSLFVGYQPELKERLLAEFEQWENFGNLEQEAKPLLQSYSSASVNSGRSDGVYNDFEDGFPDEI
jgi:Family of unknown function (DUF5895)